VYVKTTARTTKNGPVRYLHLAHNQWDPVAGRSVPKILYGFGREDLLYSEKAPDERNLQRNIVDSLRQLRPLAAAGKPVFIIEYTTNPTLAAAMLREIKELGYIGYVGDRDLSKLSPPAFGCGQPDCSR